MYEDSKEIITKNSSKFLNICKDIDYLKTDEYTPAKATSENMLFNFDMRNWTIIRFYITYNSKGLRLGELEFENWLIEILFSRSLIFPKDVETHENHFDLWR